MIRFRTLRCAVVVAAVLAAGPVAAVAQSPLTNTFVPLASLINNRAVNRAFGQVPATVNPLTYVSLHGGAMLTPRGAGLVGADVSLPGLFSVGSGWHTRIDADVVFKANLGGFDTIIPVTVDQVYYSPNAAGGHNVYYGGGVGAVLGGNTVFDGKLILGTEVTNKIGGEVNIHFTQRDTLVMLLARLHL